MIIGRQIEFAGGTAWVMDKIKIPPEYGNFPIDAYLAKMNDGSPRIITPDNIIKIL